MAKDPIKILAGVAKRAKKIQVLLMDVNGTMTDGSVTLLSQPDGTAIEIKTFDARDGQGLTLAHTAGLRTGCITGRESPAPLRRAREMKMEFIYQKQPMKIPAFEEIVKKPAFLNRRLPTWEMTCQTYQSCAASDLLSRSGCCSRS